MTGDHFKVLLEENNLFRTTESFPQTPTTKPIQPFAWGNQNEVAHRHAYLEWLTKNINLPDGVEFYHASSNTALLNSTLVSSQMNIKGTLDIAVVDKSHIKSRNIVAGIRVGIELKKKIQTADTMQVITELIVANLYSKYPAVMLLTDLREDWHFFWLEVGQVVDCVFDLKSGITLLETFIHQPNPTGQPTLYAPYLRRCNYRSAIQQPKDALPLPRDTLPQATEADVLERVLKRPKINILPKSDVADMRDVLETPDEIREWELRHLPEFLRQTPALQSCMSEDYWCSMYV